LFRRAYIIILYEDSIRVHTTFERQMILNNNQFVKFMELLKISFIDIVTTYFQVNSNMKVR